MVYNIGLECGASLSGRACNAYLAVGEKNIIIDTVPRAFEGEFIKSIEKHIPVSEIDCVFLPSVVPARAGAVAGLVAANPGITVYATAAGLRNLSEMTDSDFNGRVCKNGVEITVGNSSYVPYIIPNVTSPDTMMLFEKQEGVLYSGELFSSIDDGALYFENNLRSFVPYILPALETIERINPLCIYPLHGSCDDVGSALSLYDRLTKVTHDDFVAVMYYSRTGNNKAMADIAEAELKKTGLKPRLYCVDSSQSSVDAAREINRSAGLVLCLPTENRNMPKPVWEILSHIDVNMVSGKPYVVFSSYGWSSEGAYMANEILSMLKMRRVCKIAHGIFTPTEEDKQNFIISLKALVDFISKQKEKNGNA